LEEEFNVFYLKRYNAQKETEPARINEDFHSLKALIEIKKMASNILRN